MKKRIKKVTKEKLASALMDKDKKKIRTEGEKRKALYGSDK